MNDSIKELISDAVLGIGNGIASRMVSSILKVMPANEDNLARSRAEDFFTEINKEIINIRMELMGKPVAFFNDDNFDE